MKIKTGNILNYSDTYDAICTTTNGVISSSGRLVMGAGNAKAFKNRFRGIDRRLGEAVVTGGNVPHVVQFGNTSIVSFPTKNHWRGKSSLDLIVKSANSLVKIADEKGWKTVGIPAPGVGKGGLHWRIVEGQISNILDDRFIIHFLRR